MSLRNLSNNKLLAEKVVEAKSFCQRAIGLLGKREWPAQKTLWIHDCNSIHTFFMKFDIDAVFVDKNLRVTKVVRNLRPGRITMPDWKAKSVFEFSSNHPFLNELKPGDQLHVDR